MCGRIQDSVKMPAFVIMLPMDLIGQKISFHPVVTFFWLFRGCADIWIWIYSVFFLLFSAPLKIPGDHMVYLCSRCPYCREDGQFMITAGLFKPSCALSLEGTTMGGHESLHQKVDVLWHTHAHTWRVWRVRPGVGGLKVGQGAG